MKKIIWVYLFISILVPLSCSSEQEAVQKNESSNVVITAIASLEVSILSPIITTTMSLSPPIISTLQPSVTSTSEDASYLNIRKPSFEEFKDYLTVFASDHFYYDSAQADHCYATWYSVSVISISACGLSSDYLFYHPGSLGPGTTSLLPDEYLKDYPNQILASSAKFIYQDINGDKVDDLIVTNDKNFVTVFVWLGKHYGNPFTIIHYPWRRHQARVYFEDWTQDKSSEVIFDFRGGISGTGVFGENWFRYVIYCPDSSCYLAWHNAVGAAIDDLNSNGKGILDAKPELKTASNGDLGIDQNFIHFEIFPNSGFSDFQGLRVFTTTQTAYVWTGKEFALKGEQVIQPSYVITSQSVLTATNQAGNMATVSARFNNHDTIGAHDICELQLNEGAVISSFGCAGNFTKVEWRDITGDGQPEIIITTLSGWRVEDETGEVLSEENCFNQHLLAYQWNGQSITEVADIIGCVVQPDLYGVRLEDIDNDGQVEILAAVDWVTEIDNSDDTWYGPVYADKVYSWDGRRFTFSNQLPRDTQ